MAQVTLYLDDETDAKMRAAAREAGVSVSQWVRQLIQEKAATEWPAAVVRLHGAWSDFPTAEEIRSASGKDFRREPL